MVMYSCMTDNCNTKKSFDTCAASEFQDQREPVLECNFNVEGEQCHSSGAACVYGSMEFNGYVSHLQYCIDQDEKHLAHYGFALYWDAVIFGFCYISDPLGIY